MFNNSLGGYSSVDALKNIVEFLLILIGINDVNLKEYFKHVIGKFIEIVLVIQVNISLMAFYMGKQIEFYAHFLTYEICHVTLVLGEEKPTTFCSLKK